MIRRRKILLCVALTCLLGIAAAVWQFGPSDTVKYHEARFREGRMMKYAIAAPRAHWFYYLRWRLRGQPSLKELDDEEARQFKALERLGYFEHREFRLDLGTFDFIELDKKIFALSADRIWMFVSEQESSSSLIRVKVTATPADMKVFEAAIRQFDQKR